MENTVLRKFILVKVGIDLSSPLSGPGINIKTGDYLLAVNGVLTQKKNLYSYFAKTAGRQIALSVNNTLWTRKSLQLFLSVVKLI
jgi:hypothetical protein